MTALHQFIPTLAPRDAIGRHTLEIQRTLRGVGVRSEIYAFEAKPELRGSARPYRRFRGGRRRERTVLMYHAAIGSPIATFVAQRPEELIVDYHNVTPPQYFEAWEPVIAKALAIGRHQLYELGQKATGAFADSAFNASELSEFGFRRTDVLPILFDPATLEHDVDRDAADVIEKGHGGTDWLFVGRLAPNKSHHELLKAFAAYRHAYEPGARLRLVGQSSSSHYDAALRSFAYELGLRDAVHFTGGVSDGALAAHYATADVFVCLSEHEGFLVPLLEAMHYEIPIVAYARSAVPETLGDGGLALPRRDAATVAAAVHRVVSDRQVRDSLVERGRRRLAEFSLPRGRERLLTLLADVVDIR